MWTIIVGGGSGQRFGRLKQYELLDDLRVIDHARRTATTASDGVVVVVPAGDAEREHGVAGGATRSESVRAGLAAVPDDVDVICVHDAARPLASIALFESVVAAVVAGADAAVPGIAVTDTIKVIKVIERVAEPEVTARAAGEVTARAAGMVSGVVVATPDRSTLVAVQTPQAFRADRLRAAHAAGGEATDDAGLIEESGGRVVVVEGEAINRKITTPDDLAWTRAHIAETNR